MIRISIIVPFHNARRHIDLCIASLLAQDFPKDEYEIIMVDNNSTDVSADIVRGHPEIRLLEEPKQGAYAARNRGLTEARGEILAFTDPDCVAQRDWLKKIETTMGNPGPRIVIGSRDPGGESLILAMLSEYEQMKDFYVFNSGIGEICYGHTNNMAVRRELFEQIGPFVERQRGADTIFVRTAVDRFSCDLLAYRPDIRVRHLELDSVRTYYHKVSTYARSRRKYRKLARVKSLSLAQRLEVFGRVVRSHGYSLPKSTLLFTLLAGGWVRWVLGDLSGRWVLLQNPEAGDV